MKPARDEWRLTVRLTSRQALKQFMEFHGIKSSYELARRANLKPGVVGHLVAGRRNTCLPRTAMAIEEALQVPKGYLFAPEKSQVGRDSQRHPSRAA